MPKKSPITLQFSVHKMYKVASLIDRITDQDTPFINVRKTNDSFKQATQEIYIPLFQFIFTNKIHVTCIFTGEFIEKLEKYSPKSIKLLKKNIDKEYISVCLDAYYGNSLSSLYNMAWWARSIERTQEKVEAVLGITGDSVFLPQLFRSLELERVVHNLQKNKFILQNKGKKLNTFTTKLSELRRFGGQTVSWVEGENDSDLEFHYIPEQMFLVPNALRLEKDVNTATQAFSMNMGLQYNNFILNLTRREPAKESNPRINEKFSLGLYSKLQRSIIRLWEYASYIISSEEHSETPDYSRIKSISRNFAALQDPFFLTYLDPTTFHLSHREVTNFQSPYEAFASMQACVKHLEILLKNKI